MPGEVSGRSPPPLERNRRPAANGAPDLKISNNKKPSNTAKLRPVQRRDPRGTGLLARSFLGRRLIPTGRVIEEAFSTCPRSAGPPLASVSKEQRKPETVGWVGEFLGRPDRGTPDARDVPADV
jgi:hypothetical protein